MKVAKMLISIAIMIHPSIVSRVNLGHSDRYRVINLDELFANEKKQRRNRLRSNLLKPLS